MKSGVKTAVSLLIAILIFGGITVLSSLGMFSTVEKRFYEPARLKAINGKLDSVAECSNAYITNLLSLLGYEENSFLSYESVVSYVNQAPSDEAVRLFDSLREKLPGLDGMRIVDSTGRRVHFSSYRNDYTIQGNKRNYSNYDNLKTVRGKDELKYSVVTAFAEDVDSSEKLHGARIVFDGEEQRIVISFKLYSDEAQKNGFSVLFYINPYDFVNQLIEKHLISVNEKLTLISSSDGRTGGFVFGIPQVGQDIFANEILKKWNEKALGPDVIVSTEGTNLSGITVDETTGEAGTSGANEKFISWSLISSGASTFAGVGGLYTSESLEMPGYVRVLLLICAFITVCLIIVILFNVRKDDDVVIKSRIKGVQIGLLNEYFEKDVDRKKVAAMIESQKDALTAKIKKSLGRRGKKYGDDLEVILNRSWEDIINILSGSEKTGAVSGISSDDMNEIRRMFEEILSSGTLKVQAVGGAAAAPVKAPDEVEALEDAEPLDEVESLEEAEPLEEVEELSEIESAEEPEAAGNIPEEEVEPVEDIDVVEELDDAEALEPAELPVEAEELEEIEEADAVEELGSIELEGEAPAVRSLDDTIVLEKTVPVEDLEEVQEENATEISENAEYKVDSVDDVIELSGYDNIVDKKEESVTYIQNEVYDRNHFEGSEPLEIADRTASKSDGLDNDFNFEIFKPLDYIFDNDETETNSEEELEESLEADENSECEELEDPTAEALLLELSTEKDGFMFTTFAANDNNVTDLPLDAIVMGDDGVFQISENLAPIEMSIDEDFKKLVDAVIR